MKVILEIRAGEGGDDAKLLVPEQARIYSAYAARMDLACEIEDEGKS
jgi:protein subunit release factor A